MITVTGSSNAAVTWNVSGARCSGAACGRISTGRLYTPPASMPSPATLSLHSHHKTKRIPFAFNHLRTLLRKHRECHPERFSISRRVLTVECPPAALFFTSLRPLPRHVLAVTTAEGRAAGYADVSAVARAEQGDFPAPLVEAAGGEALSDFGEEGGEHGGDAAAHYDYVGFEQVDDIAEPDGQEADDLVQDLRGDGIAVGAGLADELAGDGVEMAAD